MLEAFWVIYRSTRQSPNLFTFAGGFFLAVFGPWFVIEAIPMSLARIPPIYPYVEHLLLDSPRHAGIAVSIELAATTMMLTGATRVLRPWEEAAAKGVQS